MKIPWYCIRSAREPDLTRRSFRVERKDARRKVKPLIHCQPFVDEEFVHRRDVGRSIERAEPDRVRQRDEKHRLGVVPLEEGR